MHTTTDVSTTRRRPLAAAVGAGALAVALLASACSDDEVVGLASESTTAAADGFDQPPTATGTVVELTRADVDRAVEEWLPLAEATIEEAGVPGVSSAIVFDDEVVWSGGFGTRELGTDEPVDADTVFQIASLSKAVGATVMAGLAGQGVFAWDDTLAEHGSSLQLSDPYVTENVTFADLYSHRSGLPDHAGDLLEDLGYDQAEILDRLPLVPLEPFRTTYAYTNFGLTAAAETVAAETGTPWADLSEQVLYGPLGMDSTSSSFADYLARDDRAIPHTRDADGAWQVTPQQRDPDPQSPAGGVSSSANDMARWMRLVLGEGTFDGQEVVDAQTLAAIGTPHIVNSAPPLGNRASSYGLGLITGVDNDGRVTLTHSGAFALGTATAVSMVPVEDLGIVTLTNGQPTGLPESLNAMFIDLALHGAVQHDWWPLFHQLIEADIYPEPIVDPSSPPADAAEPGPAADYVGTYDNAFFGPLEVVEQDGGLVAVLGPDRVELPLSPYDGDEMTLESIGENAVGPTTVDFQRGPDGEVTAVTIAWLDPYGMGTFTR